MERKNGKFTNVFAIAIFVSLGAHVLFLLAKLPSLGFFDRSTRDKLAPKEDIQLVMDPQLVERARQARAEAQKQVVATEQNGRDEKPVDSRFMGEKDQVFDRQTIAKKVDKFKAAARGATEGQRSKSEALDHSKKAAANKGAKKRSGDLKFSDLGLGGMQEAQAEQAAAQAGLEQGTANGTDQNPGIASNNDYVQDVPLGDMTHLNTTEFKYYGFYFRIRQKLEQYWGNTLKDKAAKLYKSGRRLASGSDMITSLVITINKEGKIVDVAVKSTSGVRELDDAAIESFNKAGPFPNPPKGMAAADGLIKIEWGFVVKS
jgi:TonB family protein